MSRKIKRIQLAYPTFIEDLTMYEVVKIVNSTAYNPGDTLTKKEVDDLCRGSVFDIVIQHQHGAR